MDVKDLLNIGFGVLNPIRDTLIGKNFDTSNTKPIDAIVNSAQNSYSADASKGTGPYIGICLRVDGYLNEGAIDPTNTYTIVNESIRKNNQSEAPRLIQIRVRIPEFHSALPIPQTLPAATEASTDHSVINLYPVFIAKDLLASSDMPQPGDMVWVDYQNKNTQEGPLYLGRVSNDVVINGSSTTSGRGSFAMSCTQVPAVSPPKTQPVAASNSAAGTNSIDMLSNAKKSYTPKPKTPATQNSVTVCGPVGAVQNKTNNYKGLPKDYEPTGTKDYAPADDRYLGLLNENSSKRTKKIEIIVLHDGAPYSGSQVKRVINQWLKEGKGVSSHYYIELDGTVYQLLEEAKTGHHTGTGGPLYPNDPVQGVNSRSIGIDLGRCNNNKKQIDKDGNKFNCKSRGYRSPYTKLQLTSLRKLLKDICRRHSILYDEDHILGHAAICPKRRGDPIRGFEWSEIGLTAKYGPGKYGYKQCPNPFSSGPPKPPPEPPKEEPDVAAVEFASSFGIFGE